MGDPRYRPMGNGNYSASPLTPLSPLTPVASVASATMLASSMSAAQAEGNSEDQEPVHWTEALQGAPPWLGSMVIHMMVLIFLGLIVISAKKITEDTPVQAIFGEQKGEQLIEDNRAGLSTDKPDPTVTETQFSPTDLPPVNDPFAAPPVIKDFTLGSGGHFAVGTNAIDAPIGLALSGRQRGNKRALLGAMAATPRPKTPCIWHWNG